jgi:membrane fusion protein (multidrug efflux system)
MSGILVFHKVFLSITLSAAIITGLAGCSPNASTDTRKPDKAHLVEVAAVESVDTGVTRVRTGTLRARREINIYAQEEGRVKALPYYEGDVVNKGQVLARLDDELLRSQLARAEATRNKAEQDVKRIRDLHKKKLTTDEELLRAETELEVARADLELLKTRLSYTVIKAPISGVISNRLTEPGNVVEKHDQLLTLSDPSSLVTEVSVSELLIPQMAIDDPVKVTIDALGPTVHNGRIIRIHPNLDPLTRRGMVEMELKPVPAGARPGQLCRVEFTTRVAQRLVVPFRAIRRDEQGEYVFILQAALAPKKAADTKVAENNSLEKNATEKNTGDDNGVKTVVARAPVRSGLRLGEQVEILQGLQENQKVVVRGFLGLSEGKPVKIVAPQAQSDSPSAVTPKPVSVDQSTPTV